MTVFRLPVKWVDQSILVADQTLINPPYTADSVISIVAALNGNAEENGNSLARVKHVVSLNFALLWKVGQLIIFFPFLVATRTREVRSQCNGKGTRRRDSKGRIVRLNGIKA